MQRKFLTSLGFLLLLNLLIKPFWILGVDRAVQNTLGAELYGNYYALLNFTFLFNILLDLGVTNFNNRNIAQHDQLLTKHFSSIVSLKLALGGLYFLFTISMGFIVGYDQGKIALLLILAFNQVLVSMILYFRSNLSALHLFKTDSIISVLDRALMVLFCSILLWTELFSAPFTIEWFVFAQTTAYGLTALFAGVMVLRRTRGFTPKLDRPFSLVVLKQSFPFALLILLMTFYNRVDSVMLERLLPGGEVQAGIYAQGYRLLDAANMIGFLFATLLLPMFSRMIKKGEAVAPLLNLSSRILLPAAIVLAIVCIFYPYSLMDLMYLEHLNEASMVFPFLMTSFIAVASSYIFGTLLTANGSLKQMNLMAGGGMVLNIVLNFILIPKYLAVGSAMATLITQGLAALTQAILVIRIFQLKWDYLSFLRVLVFTILLAGLSLLVKEYVDPTWWGIALIIILGLILSLVLRILNPVETYRSLRNFSGQEENE